MIHAQPENQRATRPPRRPDLSNRILRLSVAILLLAIAAYILAKPILGPAWQKPGTPLLQSLAMAGSFLLLVPFGFSLGKRGGHSTVPNRLFILHVVASLVGIGLVVPHGLAYFDGPPLLMLAGLLLLVITGSIGRIYAAPLFATAFGRKPKPFSPHDAPTKAVLRQIITDKTALLKQLDPEAREALFSVTLSHLLRRPRLALRYMRLARREAELMGARRSLPWIAAYWRPVHILLAWLFLAGLITHIVVVMFFAGYVAEGRSIYWWHVTAW